MTTDDAEADHLIATRTLVDGIASGLEILEPNLKHLAQLAQQTRDGLRVSGYRTRPVSREEAIRARAVITALCGQLDVARSLAEAADEQARELVDLAEYGPFPVPKERPDVRVALLAAGIEIKEAKGK